MGTFQEMQGDLITLIGCPGQCVWGEVVVPTGDTVPRCACISCPATWECTCQRRYQGHHELLGDAAPWGSL